VTGSPAEARPTSIEQLHATAAAALHEFRWSLAAPLELIARDGDMERWSLVKAGLPVALIDRTRGGWLLSMAGDRWTATVRRRRRRVGFHVEVTRVGWQEPLLYYHPHTLLPGGTFVSANDNRFKLGCPRLGRLVWTLTRGDREELARIRVWHKQPDEAKRIAAWRPGLTASAESEPDMRLLLAATSMAIALQCDRVVVTPGGGI
jgi:hypothetical protein